VAHLNDHVPPLLDELVAALRAVTERTIPNALLEGSPPAHAQQRQAEGFDLVEVVAEYNILRNGIYDLRRPPRPRDPARGIPDPETAASDEAIGLAVQTFAAERIARAPASARGVPRVRRARPSARRSAAISLAAGAIERSLSRDRRSTSPHRAWCGRCIATWDQLQALIEKVLKESAHVQAEGGIKLERRTFDLWPLVESLVGDLQPVADAAGTALINRVPDELTIWADASLVRRMLQNLLANAIQSAPRGEVVIGAGPVGIGVECHVSDNGAGISPDRLAAVFDKLETERGDDGGSGLGLSIVKAFAEAHGGTVGVESELGRGSTFRVTLPGRVRVV
jgi:signal transduction histidine kinase